MWALELLGDDLRRPDVDERPRRHRHQDGVRQLAGELRDRDADAQPCFGESTKKHPDRMNNSKRREVARDAFTHPKHIFVFDAGDKKTPPLAPLAA